MEDVLWREAPGVAPVALDVETSFGRTRAYRWPGTGTPVVLLHGGGMTSVSWAPYAEALSGRDVYAIDIMGDAGRSEPRARLGCAADIAAWRGHRAVGLLIAGRSEPFDEKVLAARAQALLPQLAIELVPDAGHALTVSHLDVCVAAIARTES